MFEDSRMAQITTVRSLQQRIAQMQPLSMGDDALPTPAALRHLLPGGSLQRGSTVAVRGSLQLALALVSAASAAGLWCGAIGVPDLGLEAADRNGIALERLVLIPAPGAHALSITATLSEVLGVMLLQPPSPPTVHEVERLAARLRDHGSVLLVLDDWPRTRSVLHVTASRWSGLSTGHGMLDTQELLVHTHDRRGTLKHRVRFREGKLVSPVLRRIDGGRT